VSHTVNSSVASTPRCSFLTISPALRPDTRRDRSSFDSLRFEASELASAEAVTEDD
jgi:hypothetical protein